MMYNNRSARSSRKLVACALVVIGLLGGLVLIGCGSSGSGGSSGNGNSPRNGGSPPQALQLSTADTDNSMTGSGDASFSLPLVMPARDAYKISLVDTGTPADSATTLGSALAISDPDGADQGSLGSPRLYRDPTGTKTLGATVPTTPNDFTDGLIYTFLPGDDGADAPTRGAQDSDTYYELIWRDNTNTNPVAYPSQLAAATEYTLTITAENTVSWRLRVELHDLPRLPANIATTFRGPQDGHEPPRDEWPRGGLLSGLQSHFRSEQNQPAAGARRRGY